MNSKPKIKSSEELLDKVLDNLKRDIEEGDLTVLEELLTFVPKKYLIGALDEEEWEEYTENIESFYETENSSIYELRDKLNKC